MTGILTAMNIYWLAVHDELDREQLVRRHAEINPPEDTDAQAEALGRFPSVPVIGDDRRVGAGGDDLREKNDG